MEHVRSEGRRRWRADRRVLSQGGNYQVLSLVVVITTVRFGVLATDRQLLPLQPLAFPRRLADLVCVEELVGLLRAVEFVFRVDGDGAISGHALARSRRLSNSSIVLNDG